MNTFINYLIVRKKNNRFIFAAAIGIAALFSCFTAAVVSGAGNISPARALGAVFFADDEAAALIVRGVRIPRALSSCFCGAALSVSGAMLQSVLRNRVASPGIMGVNNGAGLLILISGLIFPFSGLLRTGMAFAGALAATFIVYIISVRSGLSSSSLILAGVAVSACMSALINVVITWHPESVQDKASFNLGGFAHASSGRLYISAPVIIFCIIWAIFMSRGLDVLRLGDETAHGLGLNVKAYRVKAFICASVLSAAAVSVSGLLPFIGLIVPNCVRHFFGKRCAESFFLCAVYGAAFTCLCDMAARLLAFPYELPAGLVLSCVGAPFLIFVLAKRKFRNV